MRFKHDVIEKNSILLLVLTLLVVSVGGLVEIAPLFYLESTIEKVKGMRPYTPLELAGRNIYIREGCYNCHSQMVRPLRDEEERYGHYSLAAESMYDHPFQWGSKRTGPDLARVGGKYSDEWHVAHMVDPRDLVPESVMPSYAFLSLATLDYGTITGKLQANATVGVPYTDEMIENDTTDQTPNDQSAVNLTPMPETDAAALASVTALWESAGADVLKPRLQVLADDQEQALAPREKELVVVVGGRPAVGHRPVDAQDFENRTWQIFGAIPVPMPYSEVYSALQAGTATLPITVIMLSLSFLASSVCRFDSASRCLVTSACLRASASRCRVCSASSRCLAMSPDFFASSSRCFASSTCFCSSDSRSFAFCSSASPFFASSSCFCSSATFLASRDGSGLVQYHTPPAIAARAANATIRYTVHFSNLPTTHSSARATTTAQLATSQRG